MTSESKDWETLKTEYLNKVEKALSSVKHPHMAEVIEDVQSHLEQRFAALEPDEQTRKNLEGIIAEMGPAAEYAELLSPNTIQTNRKNRQKFLLLFSLAVVIIGGLVLLPMVLPKTAGYIVKFEPAFGFEPQTAKELLGAFNNEAGSLFPIVFRKTLLRCIPTILTFFETCTMNSSSLWSRKGTRASNEYAMLIRSTFVSMSSGREIFKLNNINL